MCTYAQRTGRVVVGVPEKPNPAVERVLESVVRVPGSIVHVPKPNVESGLEVKHVKVPKRWFSPHPTKSRKGSFLVLAAAMMVVMMAFLAFSVDVGYMLTARTEAQRSVDAAALAGAAELVNGITVANDRAVEFLVRNPAGSRTQVPQDQIPAAIAQFLQDHGSDYEIKIGHWNPDAVDPDTGQLGVVEVSAVRPSTISVSLRLDDQPLFFAPVIGSDQFNVRADSVATFRPREIMLVLDLSSSMNDDSEFKSISTFGKEAIEENLAKIYEELGSPPFGDLEFEPEYATVIGATPTAPTLPQITVEYQHESVYVTSTKDLSNIVLQFSDGSVERFEDFNDESTTGTFQGSRNLPIYKVWVKSGTNDSGEGHGYGEPFDFHPDVVNSTLITAWGLDDVPYPGTSGSWESYFNYVRQESGQNSDAGYEWKFGAMNLINYWLDKKPMASQTPDLWKGSAQPITAVKEAVDVFTDFVQEVDSKDRMGLSVYTSADGEGTLESSLTDNMEFIKDLSRHFQAGHYHVYTNIGGGLEVALGELLSGARPNASRMVVLLTDGQANWYDGFNPAAATQMVLDQAHLAAGERIKIFTISLGTKADVELMQQVADITKGHHFHIPGGQSVAEYSEELKNVFHKVADDRPLMLIR